MHTCTCTSTVQYLAVQVQYKQGSPKRQNEKLAGVWGPQNGPVDLVLRSHTRHCRVGSCNLTCHM